MNRRSPAFLCGILGLGSLIAGCNYGSGPAPVLTPDQVVGPLPTQGGQPAPAATSFDPASVLGELTDQEKKRRDAILNRVVTLMKSAAINPAGGHIRIATDSLNELFEQGTIPNDYAVSAGEARFLELKLPEIYRDPQPAVDQIISKKFTDRDARHIEDCMFYHNVAGRVAGEGDELTRVGRIFDWIVRHVQLVPPNSLSGNGIPQAEVRPADALFRGMAVEQGGRWAERGWLFMALCRQIGVDVGILTYTPRRATGPGPLADQAAPSQPPVAWACAAVIGKQLYLFDAALGLPIPGPDGTGVATLNQAIEVPEVLDRLNLPDQHYSYRANRADLIGSPTKIGVLVDSSLAYMAPRMRLLQSQLRGEYKTVLFRDPAEQAVRFREALEGRFGGTTLWELPIKVETLLFSDSEFVQSTLISLRLFDPKLPLMLARTAQLRGDLPDALYQLATLRFADKPVMKNKEETPIPPEVQHGLDVHATCFLAESQLDAGFPDKAEEIYRKALDLIPEPGPGRNAYYMTRWAAQSNLGRLCEARGDYAGAIDFYTRPDPTPQHIGNLLRARDLVWRDPFADPIPPPPPAPPDRSGPPSTASNP